MEFIISNPFYKIFLTIFGCREAAIGVECVITMLFDGKATLEAIKEMELKDKTLVMMSTVALNESQGRYLFLSS